MSAEKFRSEKIHRTFTFPLKDADYAAKGQEAANVSSELGKLEAEFKNVSQTWKGKIAEKKNELQKILTTLQAGEEERAVEATMRFNFEENKVEYIHGNVVLEERAMTEAERQVEMNLGQEQAAADASPEQEA